MGRLVIGIAVQFARSSLPLALATVSDDPPQNGNTDAEGDEQEPDEDRGVELAEGDHTVITVAHRLVVVKR